MKDREEAIKQINSLLDISDDDDSLTLPIIETIEVLKDVRELLKGQEPVKPILKRKAPNAMYNDYVCPICNQEIVYEQKYCCECGRAVKWDA